MMIHRALIGRLARRGVSGETDAAPPKFVVVHYSQGDQSMKLLKSKRAIAVTVVGALAVIGTGIGAFAYWTSGGAGTGSATGGTSVNDLQVTGTATVALTPGNSSPVTFVAGNPEAFPQTISTIHLVKVDGVTGCGGLNTSAATTTSGADFWMVDVPVPTTDGQIAAGATGQGLVTGGTLHMNNLTTQSQDACKTAILTLHFTTS
jgi:hypothetical protein